jgi:CxxC motif-containing protein (DUF1111 family)
MPESCQIRSSSFAEAADMKRPYLVWYLTGLLLALAPIGIRVATWWFPRPKPVSAAMAEAGEMLFKHEWTSPDPLAPGGDGLGPVFNARSCVACHEQGGVGGSGDRSHNVTAFVVKPTTGHPTAREGVVHAFALENRETLRDLDPQLPAVSQPELKDLLSREEFGQLQLCKQMSRSGAINFPPNIHVSQRNTPALFGANLIDAIPDRDIIANEKHQRLKWGLVSATTERFPVGRAVRLANGRVGRFGWKGQSASLADFVQAACANELGLGNPGQAQPRPLNRPDYQPPGLDLTAEQCDQLTAFVASLARPVEHFPDSPDKHAEASVGKEVFDKVGCANCHTPDVGGVSGVYSDLLLHRMGETLVGGGSYGEPAPPPSPELPSGDGPSPDEWRTPPLWGVADSAPYLHDGRASTLEEAILLHAGQAQRAAQQFRTLRRAQQVQLIAFLETLRAP